MTVLPLVLWVLLLVRTQLPRIKRKCRFSMENIPHHHSQDRNRNSISIGLDTAQNQGWKGSTVSCSSDYSRFILVLSLVLWCFSSCLFKLSTWSSERRQKNLSSELEFQSVCCAKENGWIIREEPASFRCLTEAASWKTRVDHILGLRQLSETCVSVQYDLREQVNIYWMVVSFAFLVSVPSLLDAYYPHYSFFQCHYLLNCIFSKSWYLFPKMWVGLPPEIPRIFFLPLIITFLEHCKR